MITLCAGDGVRSSALAHAVQLKDGDVEAHEVLQCVFGDGSCTCVTGPTAVKTQSFSYILENQGIRQREAPRH